MRPKIFPYVGSKSQHEHWAAGIRCLFDPTQNKNPVPTYHNTRVYTYQIAKKIAQATHFCNPLKCTAAIA